ncbi:hypothetical protein [Virgibacillus doumboii]|uniref:hypothetical protein n=1 Tax=Virgibacillus doumboii TaxID=2697503 RepID=UPI0013E0AF47|nr:hypothetical protein [Virgibacillus doumboii]
MGKIRLNLNTLYIGAAIVTVGAVLIVFLSELGGVWINGISYLASDVEDYHNNAHAVEGKYKVEIDLSDLESNKGKVLFDDGENRIYVSRVIVKNGPEYEVFFRSSGTFSLGGATLVSGVDHTHEEFRAEAKATYSGKSYKISQSDYSGLKYRNGDEFGFYLFPPEEDIDVDLEEESMIEVTVENLYVNLWAEK